MFISWNFYHCDQLRQQRDDNSFGFQANYTHKCVSIEFVCLCKRKHACRHMHERCCSYEFLFYSNLWLAPYKTKKKGNEREWRMEDKWKEIRCLVETLQWVRILSFLSCSSSTHTFKFRFLHKIQLRTTMDAVSPEKKGVMYLSERDNSCISVYIFNEIFSLLLSLPSSPSFHPLFWFLPFTHGHARACARA